MSDEVIILGAGSSKSYGFPTGAELLEIIINGSIKTGDDAHNFYTNEELNEILIFNKYYNNCIEFYKKKYNYDDHLFRRNLKISGTKTIDTYLSNSKNIDDETFGKFAISSIISFYENINQMEKHSNDNWMDYFFNQRISYQLKDFISKPPQIITFNYDTFFEHKLIKHLEKEHSFADADNFILDKNFITHVYGNLNNESYKDISYQIERNLQGSLTISTEVTNINFKRIEQNSKNIDFIRASNLKSDKIEKIRSILENASKIYILGYGFDKFNNEILFENENFFLKYSKRNVYFTGFGLEESLKSALSTFKMFNKTAIQNDMKCLDLLKKAMPHKLFPEKP